MEPLLPKSARTVLLDGTSVPVQHIRGGRNPAKLPAPSYGRLVVSRRQLGAPIYRSTTDFAVTAPHIRSPDLTYNCLHDPHLRDYFNQPGRLKQLKKANFITEDNEVICSLREYKAHEGYLRDLKMLADRDFDELWKKKMELMVELQRKGLIPEDVWIDDMIDHVLEERTEDFRALIKKDAAKKRAKRRAETGEDELSEDDEDLAIEVALLDWQAEIRRRLALFEKQLWHQRNRERHYQALQEERERKKAAAEERQRATLVRRLREKVEKSEKDALKGRKMVPQQETVLDVVLECSGSSESSEEEIRAPAPQKSPKAREKMDDNRAKPQGGKVTRPSPPEPQGLLPQRPRKDQPVLRPCTANQKQPPVHLKSANDVGWYPEKAKILWDQAIQRFIDKVKIRKPRAPKVPQPKPPKTGIERIYGLLSKDAYKNVPQRIKTTTTKPSPKRRP